MDCQFDVTIDGRPIEVASIIDEHTRECLGGVVERSITGEDLIRELDRLAAQRGTFPAVLRCDNGPELTCSAMVDWAAGQVGLHFIPPGERRRNGCVESFTSRIRDECRLDRLIRSVHNSSCEELQGAQFGTASPASASTPSIRRPHKWRAVSGPAPGDEPDVLIVGAGPTGLTAAVVLAAHGVAARVVDPESGPTDQSRALVVQARTLELWDKLGLAEPALAAGKPMTAVVAYSNGTALNGGRSLLPLAELGTGQTPYPFLLVFEQSKTERLLLDKLHELDGAVDWGVTAEAITPVDSGVEVTLRRDAAGENGVVERVRPRWVIGADGASSTVRHALGLGFEGGSYEQAFFLADVAVTWAQPPHALYVALTDTGTFLFVPMPTDAGEPPRYRVLGSLTAEMAAKERLDIADVQIAIDNHAGVRATVSDARWVSLYRLHHRMAERFRVGNVFLAGDAAHIHSPVGGQGMNTGIQDAYNLAWKLALAAQGHAGETLLDSYASERMPVARALLGGTDAAFNVIVSDRRLVRLTRRLAAPLLPSALRLARGRTPALFAMLSQIAISYAIGGATPPQGGPRPGDRAPHSPFLTGEHAGESVFAVLRGPDHHLLILDRSQPHPVIPDAVTAALARQPVAVHAHPIIAVETLIHDAYGATAPTMVLIRPDGYVAWRGPVTDVDGLAVYLDELAPSAD